MMEDEKVLQALRERRILFPEDAAHLGLEPVQMSDALVRLAGQGMAEEAAPSAWRPLRHRPPRLGYSRTWSNPSGPVPEKTVIAATLADPKINDLIELCVVFGLKSVQDVLFEMVQHGDIPPQLVEWNERCLRKILSGFQRGVPDADGKPNGDATG